MVVQILPYLKVVGKGWVHTRTCSAVVVSVGGPHGQWWWPSEHDRRHRRRSRRHVEAGLNGLLRWLP